MFKDAFIVVIHVSGKLKAFACQADEGSWLPAIHTMQLKRTTSSLEHGTITTLENSSLKTKHKHKLLEYIYIYIYKYVYILYCYICISVLQHTTPLLGLLRYSPPKDYEKLAALRVQCLGPNGRDTSRCTCGKRQNNHHV